MSDIITLQLPYNRSLPELQQEIDDKVNQADRNLSVFDQMQFNKWVIFLVLGIVLLIYAIIFIKRRGSYSFKKQSLSRTGSIPLGGLNLPNVSNL